MPFIKMTFYNRDGRIVGYQKVPMDEMYPFMPMRNDTGFVLIEMLEEVGF